MNFLYLEVSHCEVGKVFAFFTLHHIKLLQFLVIDYILYAKNYSLVVLFGLFRQSVTLKLPQSRYYAVSVGHVNETDELILVILDVKVEKFD